MTLMPRGRMAVSAIRLPLLLPLLLWALAACSDSGPVFHAATNPQRLSEWNLFELDSETLAPVAAGMVFRPANQLFTDYARKLRTLWIPAGSQARLVDGEIDYPVGTVLSKTFYYPSTAEGSFLKQADKAETQINLQTSTLIETRLLVRRESGWDAFPYVWNDEQTEAFLRVAGTSRPVNLKSDTGTLDFVYFVPNENQCSGCHTTEHPDGDMHPLGAIAEQLASPFYYPDSNGDRRIKRLDSPPAPGGQPPGSEGEFQIDRLIARGWLNGKPEHSAPVSWRDESAPIAERALAYLNMQCGHCHNPDGVADTSALLLDGSHDLAVNMGVCKTPVAAGGGAGDMLYSIVPGAPERSILLYRMGSDEPDEMMPELGRSLIHVEGIELIADWITAMPGSC